MWHFIQIIFLLAFISACSEPASDKRQGEPETVQSASAEKDNHLDNSPASVKRRAFFGDLHIHTSYSLDGYIIYNRTTPHDAYVFARGGEIEFYKNPRKLDIPLDFAAVTEHAEFLGESAICTDPQYSAYSTDVCTDMRNENRDPEVEYRTYVTMLLNIVTAKKPTRLPICGQNGEICLSVSGNRWKEIQEIADKRYVPGEFTTFVAYEWTGQQGGNRHRNVIFRNSSVPETAWSMIEVPRVEQLWSKLDEECTSPCEVITISHNSNQSKGLRFAGLNPEGEPFNAEEAAYRSKHEPLVEIIQFKGESECRLGVNTEDEFCEFEKYDLRPHCAYPDSESTLNCVVTCDSAGQPEGCISEHNYVRNALKSGLEFTEKTGENPYKLGFIGSTDTHNSNPGNTEEKNYQGNFGYLDAEAEDRLKVKLESGFKELSRNPGALAGVWAIENTRDGIFDALKSRETFATSGNRMLVQFFAGWDFPEQLQPAQDVSELGYQSGVAMGGDLGAHASSGAPRFLVWAAKAVDGHSLQRAQIIKGWVHDGKSHEKVYDVACADGLAPDEITHRCPDNGASVNLRDCSVSHQDSGKELQTVWQDPDFDKRQHAFYYLRVLENLTCRWSTYDSLRLGRLPPVDAPATIQERAWSSPIWYRP